MLYAQSPKTSFYCACSFVYEGKKLVPNLSGCGYKVRAQKVRASRIEWEHIMPASDMTKHFGCKNRKDCKSNSKDFNKASGDLHNLVPAIGEVNGDRSNYRFQDWNGEPLQYGVCEVVVDFKARQVQPPAHAKGLLEELIFI